MEGQIIEYDVIVVGSGAAGLSAGITASYFGRSVLVVEKQAQVGGTTALSGGWLWVPGNSLAKRAGATDTTAQANTYIAHQAGNAYDSQRVKGFLAYAGEMVDFFQAHTEVKFTFGANYPDYHPNQPGGVEQGRSIHPVPFDGMRLGDRLKDLATPMREATFMGMGLNSGPDLKHFLNATRSLRSAFFVAGRMLSHGRDVLLHGRGTRLVNGNALAARLFRTVLDRNIPLWTGVKVIDLVRNGERVQGVIVEQDGVRKTIHARQGVVLAAGGFPQDRVRRARSFGHPNAQDQHVSMAPAGNVGDGINLAEAQGAQIIDSYKNAAAWVPVSMIKHPDGSMGRFFHLIDRAKPGIIAVTADGRRFTNESQNYHDFVRAMIDSCAGQPEVFAFMVCDHRALRRYGLGAVRPSPLPIGSFIRSGYLLRGDSIADLARQAGIAADGLVQTVQTLNRDAAKGVDAWGKGSTSYQRLLGDTDHTPNPCIAPIDKGPFYAVRIIPGDIGTYHGIRTDAATRVLDANAAPIPGLYAVGNDAASIFGGSYPGAGATLGPAMTFGYICGRTLAETGAATEPSAVAAPPN